MTEFVFDSDSEDDTVLLGRRLAGTLRPGLTVALNGQLGAGKTNLVRAVCVGLGMNPDTVNSPTFILMQTYSGGRLPVFHFDTYRLGDVDEFLAIGAEEYLMDPEVVCFVEWASRIEEVLPADHLVIQIEQTSPSSRRFCLSGTGPTSNRVVDELRNQPTGDS